MILRNDYYSTAACAILLFLLSLKVFAASQLSLFEDEAVYWNWSKTIDPSYSLTTLASILFSTTIAGSHNEFAVRLPAIMNGIFLIFILYASGKLLGAGRRKLFAGILFFMSVPFVTAYTFSITPDSYLLLFCSLTIYFALRIIRVNRKLDWLFCGISIGLAILSKYQGLILAVSVLIYFIYYFRSSPDFFSRIFMMICAIVAVTSPMLIWNILNEAVWLQHYLYENVSVESESLLSRLSTFMLGQITVLMPLAFIFLILIIYQSFRSNAFSDPCNRFIIFAGILMQLVFLAMAVSGKSKGNWSFISFIPLFLLVFTIEFKPALRSLFISLVAFNLLFAGILILPASSISELSKTPAGKFIDKSFMYYWPESVYLDNSDKTWSDRIIAMKLNESKIKNLETFVKRSGIKYDFIVCNDFNLSGLINYYFDGNPDTYIIGDMRFRYLNSLETQNHLYGKDALAISVNGSKSVPDNEQFDEIILLSEPAFVPDKFFNAMNIMLCRNYKPVKDNKNISEMLKKR